MKIIPEKMYSYDFVYGKSTINQQPSVYTIERVSSDSPQLREWVETRVNVLTGEKYSESDWNYTFSFTKEGHLCAIIKAFT